MSMHDYREYLVAEKGKMPANGHWAILVFTPYSIHYEGDERSRTNPGHGYPAHTESGTKLEYYAFPDKAAWMACISHLEAEAHDPRSSYKRVNYSALVVAGQPKISTNIVIDIPTVKGLS